MKQNGQRFCSLIYPQQDWIHWDIQAEKLHGISQQLLRQKGRPIKDVCFDLNHFLSGETGYSDGWVVDQPWLIKLFHAANMKMAFSISSLDMLLNEGQMGLWHQTKEKLMASLKQPRHRASHDAALIQSTYKLTLDLVLQQRSQCFTP